MSRPIAYGIDFGTTNTVVSLARSDSVEVLPLGERGSEVVPSMLYLHRNGNRALGHEAIRQFAIGATSKTRCGDCSLRDNCGKTDSKTCRDSRLLFAIKGALASEDVRLSTWGRLLEPQDMLSEVLRLLKRKADTHVGSDVQRVVLGYPVVFEGAEGSDAHYEVHQRLALSRLENAARSAGFREVALVAEPQASAPADGLPDGLVVAVDFGGGTFDVMVAESQGGRVEAKGFGGTPIGGQRFDQELYLESLAGPLGLERDYILHGENRRMPAWLRRDLGSWQGVQRLLRENKVAADIRAFAKADGSQLEWVSDVLYGGQAYRFLSVIENAKVQLSSADATAASFSWPGFAKSISLSRSEFEAAIEPLMAKCFDQIERALASAQVSACSVDTVVVTGGSSMLPIFRRRIAEVLPDADLLEGSVFTSVSNGLAEHARERWQ